MTAPQAAARRRLAYVYHPRSFPGLMLVEAARDVCDLVWIVDTSNAETKSMARLLKRFGTVVDVTGLSSAESAELIAAEEPDGILALADDLIVWTSEVAERLALPFVSPVVARRLTDKFLQREALGAGGLPIPGFWRIDEGDTASALDRIETSASFPVVLKPRNGEGSRDTLPAASFDELTSLFESVHVSVSGVAREFVVEEFIPDIDRPIAGEGFAGYVSVESFVSHGRVTHLAVSGRTPAAPPFRETGLFTPSALGAHDRDQVLDTARRAAEAIGVTIGCLHTEIKLTPAGPVVIEVNGRIGGGVPEILEMTTGISFLGIAFRLALGDDVDIPQLPQQTGVAYHLMVQAPAELHRVAAVDGLDALRALEGVRDIALNKGIGKELDWRDGNTGNVFIAQGHAADHDAFRRVLDHVATKVVIRGE